MNTTQLNPAKGLRLIRTANILAIISTCISIISVIVVTLSAGIGVGAALDGGAGLSGTAALTAGVAFLVGILGVIGGVVLTVTGGIMEIVGLAKNSRVHSGFKTALILVLAGMAVSLVVALLPLPAGFDTIMSAVSSAVTALVVFVVIGATSSLLVGKGDQDISASGLKVRTTYIICAAIAIVAELLAFIPALAPWLSICTMIAAIVQLVALFGYIKFLGKAAKALQE